MLEYYVGFWLTFGNIIVTAIKIACEANPILGVFFWILSEIAIYYILQFLSRKLKK